MADLEKKIKALLNEQAESACFTEYDTKRMKEHIDETLKRSSIKNSKYIHRRRKFLVAFIVGILLIFSTVVGAHNDWISEKIEQINNNWFNYGQIRKEILEENEEGIIAKVNDISIMDSQLKIWILEHEFKYNIQMSLFNEVVYSGPKPIKKTETELLNDLINNEILYQEAVKHGVAMTLDEVSITTNRWRQSYLYIIWTDEHEKKPYEDFELYLQNRGLTLKEYEQEVIMRGAEGKMLDGMGMTYDKYYEEILKIQQKTLSVSKLINNLFGTDEYSLDETFIQEYLKSLKVKGHYSVEILK